jgi:hypothetical protein
MELEVLNNVPLQGLFMESREFVLFCYTGITKFCTSCIILLIIIACKCSILEFLETSYVNIQILQSQELEVLSRLNNLCFSNYSYFFSNLGVLYGAKPNVSDVMCCVKAVSFARN